MQEAYPLEGQGSHGYLMRAALGALLAIEGAGPEGLVDGLCRPFHDGLAHEGRALPTPVHPALLAAALRNRRDARVALQLLGAGEAFALFAEAASRRGVRIVPLPGKAWKSA